MGTTRIPQRSFAAGELDERFSGLADNDQYVRGLRLGTGCYYSQFGTLIKRNGTERVAATLAAQAQLHTVDIPGEGTKVLVLTSTQIQCYDAASRTIESTVSYSSIWDSSTSAFKQAISIPVPAENQIWFLHPDHPPLRLKRLADATWEADSIIEDSAWVDPLLTARTLSTSMTINDATAGGGGTATLTAGTPYFKPSDVENNSIWFIGKNRDTTATSSFGSGWIYADTLQSDDILTGNFMDVTPGGASSTMTTSDWTGPWLQGGSTGADITISGGFTAGSVCTLTGSTTWLVDSDVGSIISIEDNARIHILIRFVSSGTVAQGTIIDASGGTLVGTAYTAIHQWWVPAFREFDGNFLMLDGPTGSQNLFSRDPIMDSGMSVAATDRDARFQVAPDCSTRVTAYVDRNNVTVDITGTWAQADVAPRVSYSPLMSDYHGWASCGTLHQGRMVLGGFKRLPQSLCFSKTNRIMDFTVGSNDDEGFTLVVQQATGEWAWLVSGQDLLGGTSKEEFAIRGAPITPSEVKADVQTTYGGLRDKAALVGGAALFVTRAGTGLREMQFRFETDRFAAPDLTDLNKLWSNVTAAVNIRRQPCFVREPDPIVLAIENQTTLTALTYRPENGVVGWSNWHMSTDPGEGVQDLVESVVNVSVEERDEIWITTLRWRNSTAYRHLEVISDSAVMDAEETITVTSGGTDTDIIAAPNFAYRTVHVILKGGVWVGEYTVSAAGVLDISNEVATTSEVTVGYNIPLEIEPQVIQFDQSGGASDGRQRTVKDAKLVMVNSYGAEIGQIMGTDSGSDVETFYPIFVDQEANVSLLADSFSGVKQVALNLGGEEARPRIRGTGPWRFELSAISLGVEVGD